MLNETEIEKIRDTFGKNGQKVLSFYVNRHTESYPEQMRKAPIEIKKTMHSLEETVPPEELQSFQKNTEAIEEILRGGMKGKACALFAAQNGKQQICYRLNVTVPTLAVWRRGAFIQPLIKLLDEHERFGVILIDRIHARLFWIVCGEIEEKSEILASEATKDTSQNVRDYAQKKLTAKDQRMSSDQNMKHSDEHSRWHWQHVAEILAKMEPDLNLDRLILGGPHEAVKALESFLPKSLKQRLCGYVSLPLDAPPQEVLEKSMEVAAAVERQKEEELVHRLIVRAGKNDKAVLGLENVEQAVGEGRIHKLLYTHDYEAAFISLIPKVLETGGSVEELRGKPAETLSQKGGVGALLRY